MHNPLIVALDVPDAPAALRLVDDLAPVAGAFKVGKELFIDAGPDLVRAVRARGAAVFLDLKLHDIPNTVAHAVQAAVRLDVQMVTLHASGGRAMLEAAARAAAETASALGRVPPLLLGVTVLTSLTSEALVEIGCEPNIGRQVERLATLATAAGLRGLVCSPLEVVGLRQILPPGTKLVTPGIRAPGTPADDQKRTLSAREAVEAGADYLVVGRPVIRAPSPRAAAEAILASLQPKPAP